jgi:hypothetical protein
VRARCTGALLFVRHSRARGVSWRTHCASRRRHRRKREARDLAPISGEHREPFAHTVEPLVLPSRRPVPSSLLRR